MSDTSLAAAPGSSPPVGRDVPSHRRGGSRDRGRPGWARLSLLVTVVWAAVVYAWNVGHMQLHLYYGPGVKTMSESWQAWLFGAYDPQLATTFDELTGAFWLQALFARVFGYTPWAVLLPSLIASVGAVVLLYTLVHRWLGPVAAVVAAAAYATTPVVAALARTQIPDPVLVALLLIAALTWQTAVRDARTGPLLLTGLWVGLAFQVKMAQAWLIWLPFGVAYLLFAPTRWARRVWQLAAAGALTVAVSLSWVVVMALLPTDSRPYVDGSVDNSIWSMVFGYNGLNRYGMHNAGAEVFGVGGPPGRPEGSPWLYLVRDGVAPQIGWLYPVALVGLGAGIVVLARRNGPTPATRAGYVMWALWLIGHTVVFAISVKAHTFYNLAIAPAVAAFAGAGVHHLWRRYPGGNRWLLPATIAATAAWGWYLAGHFPTFAPWLPLAVVIAGAAGVLVPLLAPRRPAVLVVALAAVLVAPVTWTLSVTDNLTVSDAHRPAAGPPSRETASILSGRLLRMLPAAEVERITAYVRANSTTEQYQLAVQWAPQAGQFLLRDLRVLPIGGFTAQAPTITPDQLAGLASASDLRFALVDGPATQGRPTPDYPRYAEWVRAACRPVPEFDQPLYTLYTC